MATPLQFALYEVLPCGSVVPCGWAASLEDAWRQLSQLARYTSNESFALDARTHRVVAQINVPLAAQRASRRIFQIAYTQELALEREEVLVHRGYNVTTVIGNESAKSVLASTPPFDLFILGHGASEQFRKEMIRWLRERYPNTKMISLNPFHQRLDDADYNVLLDGPETWLPAVSSALGS